MESSQVIQCMLCPQEIIGVLAWKSIKEGKQFNNHLLASILDLLIDRNDLTWFNWCYFSVFPSRNAGTSRSWNNNPITIPKVPKIQVKQVYHMTLIEWFQQFRDIEMSGSLKGGFDLERRNLGPWRWSNSGTKENECIEPLQCKYHKFSPWTPHAEDLRNCDTFVVHWRDPLKIIIELWQIKVHGTHCATCCYTSRPGCHQHLDPLLFAWKRQNIAFPTLQQI